jgi:hypothetical protein
MLVHRARRLSLGQLVPRPTTIFDSSGRPIVRMAVVDQLAQDPGRSDVETFLAQGWGPAKAGGKALAPVLRESADTAIDGVLRSTIAYVEAVATDLTEIWSVRRANPVLIAQPRAQWPTVPSTPPLGFTGYDEGTIPYEPDTIIANPVLHARLLTSRLTDDFGTTWDAMDGGQAP